MPVQNDGTGAFFIGDCVYANHNPGFSAFRHLRTGIIHNVNFPTELSNLCTSAGLPFRDVYSLAVINPDGSTVTFTKKMITFAANSLDTIDDRYSFGLPWNTVAGSGIKSIQFFDDNGEASGTDSQTNTNELYALGIDNTAPPNLSFASSANRWQFPTGGAIGATNPNNEGISLAAMCDGEGLGVFHSQTLYESTLGGVEDESTLTFFQYAGILDDVNTGFSYYNASPITKSVSILCRSFNSTALGQQNGGGGAHYIALSPKLLLGTGDANYVIVCSDAQVPTPTWATEALVFDNDPVLGYPAIGTLRNFIIVQGGITIGSVIDIQGLVFPDAGTTTYLAVGAFAGKTLCMKCYVPPP